MTSTVRTIDSLIPELNWLWKITLGHPAIRIAIIDGEVNRNHPVFKEAKLERLQTFTGLPSSKMGVASQHGTHITSIIFGQHASKVKGIAPYCSGLSLPVFFDDNNGEIVPCSQIDLARAITQAVDAGAHIINISGGELNNSGKAHILLEKSLKYCLDKNVLVIAAAGNDGCACLHIPGSLPSVLVVGGMDDKGNPLKFSNWGSNYWDKGVLAIGENILGALSNNEIGERTGTSYAAAVVSGIAALLLSYQYESGKEINPLFVRETLLNSAIGCGHWNNTECQKLLKGRINIKEAYSLLKNINEKKMQGNNQTVSLSHNDESSDMNSQQITEGVNTNGITPSCAPKEVSTIEKQMIVSTQSNNKVQASDCGCGGGDTCSCKSKNASAANTVQLVYALGSLGYDLVSEARRDSIMQHLNGNPNDSAQMLKYLEQNPWEAASITWTLNLDATPIYAIQPYGAFAADGYKRLRSFLSDGIKEGADRISVPGYLAGQTRLMSGQVVPIIMPDLRCMYNWHTAALLETILGKAPTSNTKDADKKIYEQQKMAIANFLERVYHELRNLGTTSQDRAINYAATNALNAAGIFAEAIKDNMQLDTIDVERSPICRLDSDCWDVLLTFFDPANQFQKARKVYRFTIDVSDVCPVMVGAVRSWFVR